MRVADTSAPALRASSSNSASEASKSRSAACCGSTVTSPGPLSSKIEAPTETPAETAAALRASRAAEVSFRRSPVNSTATRTARSEDCRPTFRRSSPTAICASTRLRFIVFTGVIFVPLLVIRPVCDSGWLVALCAGSLLQGRRGGRRCWMPSGHPSFRLGLRMYSGPPAYHCRDRMLEDELLLTVVLEQHRVLIKRADLSSQLHAAYQVDRNRALVFPHRIEKCILNVLCRL